MDALEYLKKEIEKLEITSQKEEVGEVVEIKDEVLKINGLLAVENMEMIQIEGRKTNFGIALSLEEEMVGALLFGDSSEIKEGDIVKRTNKTLSVPVGDEMIGRVINPLGAFLDEGREVKFQTFYPLEKIGPSVVDREPVSAPLHTGIKAIDSLVPIGRGQRELLLGDRGTTKSSVAIDVILNQKNESQKPICIYAAIGQKSSDLARTIEIFKKNKALDYTIVVSASASDPISFWYLAPYTAAALGEYFMDRGRDALVVFDNLTSHAWAWRQISLVLRRPPGREAYPGDIFYLHSRLLERAAKLNKKRGGGSLTALPIVETQAGDITGYIPTNIISICDGQIFFDTGLYLKGQRPEISIGLSVSRVGSSAQTKAMKKIASQLKLDIAQFEELETFLEFAEEVDPEIKKKLNRGMRMREILKQEEGAPLPFEKEIAVIFAGVKGFLDEVKIENIKDLEKNLLETIEIQKPEIFQQIKETRDLSPEIETELAKIIKETISRYAIERN